MYFTFCEYFFSSRKTYIDRAQIFVAALLIARAAVWQRRVDARVRRHVARIVRADVTIVAL